MACYPDHMVHMGVKSVGNLRDSGGWWAHGRGPTQDKRKDPGRVGYTYRHSMEDGFSGLAYTEPLIDEKIATSIAVAPRPALLRRSRHRPAPMSVLAW